MENDDLIPVEQLCSHYQIEVSFIHSLSEYELIEIITIKETQYISTHQLRDIEKMIRLHVDLDINMEGIDVIFHLLRKMERLDSELKLMMNQLNSGSLDKIQ